MLQSHAPRYVIDFTLHISTEAYRSRTFSSALNSWYGMYTHTGSFLLDKSKDELFTVITYVLIS